MADISLRASTLSKNLITTLDGDEVFRVIDNPSGAAADRRVTADTIAARAGAYFSLYRPERYGAIGDGVTDDTVAFQAAVNAAAAAREPLVARNTYRLTAQISLPSYSVIDGGGVGGVIRDWTATLGNVDTQFQNANYAPVSPLDVSIHIRGLRFSVTALPTAGGFVYFGGVTDFSIIDCHVVTDLDNTIIGINGCQNGVVRGNYINSENATIYSDGIHVSSCRRLTISGNIIITEDDAVAMAMGDDTFSSNLNAFENTDITVTGNVLQSVKANCLRISTGGPATLPSAINNGRYSRRIVATGNTMRKKGVGEGWCVKITDDRNGLPIKNGDIIIASNTIDAKGSGTGSGGINIGSNSVTYDVISHAYRWDSISIHGNDITVEEGAFVTVEGVKELSFLGNTLRRAPTGPTGSSSDISFRFVRSLVLNNNRVTFDNLGRGISLHEVVLSVVNNNSLEGAALSALYVNEGAQFQASGNLIYGSFTQGIVAATAPTMSRITNNRLEAIAYADAIVGFGSDLIAHGNRGTMREIVTRELGTTFMLAKSAVASATLTGTLAETALATITVPGGAMGPNGMLEVEYLGTHSNSANAKTYRIRFGGLSGNSYCVIAPTTTNTSHGIAYIANRNSEASQVGNSQMTQGGWGSIASGVVTNTVNTANAQDIIITGQLANTGDTMVLERYSVKISYGD